MPLPPRKWFDASLALALLIVLATAGLLCGQARAGTWQWAAWWPTESPTDLAITSDSDTPADGPSLQWYGYIYYGVLDQETVTAVGTWQDVDGGQDYGRLMWVPSGESSDDSRFQNWTPGNNNPFDIDLAWAADPPPNPARFLENADADYYGTGNIDTNTSFTGTANDGFGDPLVDLPNLPTGCSGKQSAGKHLIQMPDPDGIVVLTSSATASASEAPLNSDSTATDFVIEWDMDPTQDSRGASITSDLGQTYHKDPSDGSRQPDLAASDGTITANTVLPDPGEGSAITYHGHATAEENATTGWAANSSYLIHCNSQDPPGGSNSIYTESGSFSPGDDPVGEVAASYSSASTTEHAYLHLTDASDGANATANYYVTFHPQWENLIQDPNSAPSYKDQYVYLMVADLKTGVQNPTGSQGTTTGQWNFTITGTVSLSASLNAGFSLADFISLGGSFTPSISLSVGSSIGVTSPPIDPGYMSYPFLDFHYPSVSYLVDQYDTSGYNSTVSQTVDNASQATLTVGWTPQQKIGL